MNARDLLGMKIINKEAKDVAKVAEINIDVKTYKITKIYGSIGNPISKKYYEIDPDEVIALGDYLLIETKLNDLEGNTLDKIPKATGNNVKVNDIIGKTVLDAEGNVAGKVSNVDSDFENFEVNNITITKSSSFGMSKDNNIILKDDISSIGDYVIVNKIFKKTEEPDDKEKEEKNDDTEKVKVDIE